MLRCAALAAGLALALVEAVPEGHGAGGGVEVAAGANSTRAESKVCSKKDDAGDCAALTALAKSAGFQKGQLWNKAARKNWLTGASVCDWYGVSCKKGRVAKLQLKAEGLRGSLPSAIGSLSELTVLDIRGTRPDGYGPRSCLETGATNFNNSGLPHSFYSLSKLQTVNLEYTCLGGTLAPERISQPLSETNMRIVLTGISKMRDATGLPWSAFTAFLARVRPDSFAGDAWSGTT